MQFVTSESQFTTKNPELKIPLKIPLQSGRTVAIGPRKNHEISVSYSHTQNGSAAKILKNKNQMD